LLFVRPHDLRPADAAEIPFAPDILQPTIVAQLGRHVAFAKRLVTTAFKGEKGHVSLFCAM
jgi:hypothetical protein